MEMRCASNFPLLSILLRGCTTHLLCAVCYLIFTSIIRFVTQKCPGDSICFEESPCILEGQTAPGFLRMDASKMFCGRSWAEAAKCDQPCPGGSDGTYHLNILNGGDCLALGHEIMCMFNIIVPCGQMNAEVNNAGPRSNVTHGLRAPLRQRIMVPRVTRRNRPWRSPSQIWNLNLALPMKVATW